MSLQQPGFLMSSKPGDPTTNPTIFLRLRAGDAAPREIAWDEFNARYAPIIAGFARRLATRAFHRSAYQYFATHTVRSPWHPARWLAWTALTLRSWWRSYVSRA